MLITDRTNLLVCELDGWLDVTRARSALEAIATTLADSRATTLVLDLRAVAVADPVLCRLVTDAHQRMASRAGSVVVVNANPGVANLLRAAEIDRLAAVYDSPEALPTSDAASVRATVRRRSARERPCPPDRGVDG